MYIYNYNYYIYNVIIIIIYIHVYKFTVVSSKHSCHVAEFRAYGYRLFVACKGLFTSCTSVFKGLNTSQITDGFWDG